jgi:undecaprenyl diphosphate synthase
MDGNGRWAARRGLPRVLGHRAGMKALTAIVEASSEIGIKYLTVYSFSTENWERPRAEVSALMSLLREYVRKEGRRIASNNVKVNIIGDLSRLPAAARKAAEQISSDTAANTGLIFNIALNYGSRQEIIRAVNSIAADGVKNVDEKIFRRYLYTGDMPDPDLVIRTSGEQRISNFLLFQIAYSEFYLTDTLWPDFDKDELLLAIKEFSGRLRRYGRI